MTLDSALEGTLKRDRFIVLGALALVIALAWAYVLAGAGMELSAVEVTAMAAPAVWDLRYALLMVFMWWIMMVAMMLPSATPMVLLFTAINRKQKERGNPCVPTALFASAYLLCWAGFSLVAVALQWGFERAALLTPTLVSASAVFGGLLLVGAGIYQLTPLKQACLKHCRSPLQFITTRWRNGRGGALRMGLEHGAYCVGCCWFLMGLLFFGGVMNLYWIAGLALFVLVEKFTPPGHWIGSLTGAALIGWGGWVLLTLL